MKNWHKEIDDMQVHTILKLLLKAYCNYQQRKGSTEDEIYDGIKYLNEKFKEGKKRRR